MPDLVPVVSYDESDGNSIGDSRVSEGEPLEDYGPPASHIAPEQPIKQLSE